MSKCIFCKSNKKITQEHVIPKWLAKKLTEGMDSDFTAEILASDGKKKTYSIKGLNQSSRTVCIDCNNGWMSDLEDRVQKRIGPMILDGERTDLDRDSRLWVAAWALKTAFMLHQLSQNEPIIPTAELHKFYKSYESRKKLPDGYCVWLAHRSTYQDGTGRGELIIASREQPVGTLGVVPELTEEFQSEMLKPGRTIFRSTFAFGRVVFQVFGHNVQMGINIGIPQCLQRVVQLVWPIQSNHVDWPPPMPVDGIGGIDGLHRAFDMPGQVGKGATAENLSSTAHCTENFENSVASSSVQALLASHRGKVKDSMKA
jgi:hypothetical protein